jgi:predicted secreted Zn-dependent protease
MRLIGFGPLVVLASAVAWPAFAGVKTTVRTETYAIAGNTGEALLDAMDRRGPRHGLRARAMAQTRYKVEWNDEWLRSGSKCRLKSADATLSIVYRYPALVRPASRKLERRWKAFMAGVRQHEEMHGRLARQMVLAAYKSVSRLARSDDLCIRSQRQFDRIIDAVYAKYEARQARFDDVEHGAGGNVDRLLDMLTRE